MRYAFPALAFVTGVLASAAACGRGATQEDGYAGTWVTKAGDHVMFVLTLEAEGGGFTGSLQRPRNLSTSDGLRFSNVGGGTVRERVVSASPDASALRIATEDPADASDRSNYVMTLDGTGRATLAPEGWPFEPWRVTRVPGAETPQVFEGWEASRSYSVLDTGGPSNAALQAIFEADQSPRQGQVTRERMDAIQAEDTERRARTKELIDAGELHTGEDFHRAAIIFQHGDEPEHFLYAHTLATIAVLKGDATAAWIGAATLDRYLQSIGQPQIYGTQFTFPSAPGANDSTFLDPFNRELISDALRRQAGVLALEDQLSMMRQSQAAAEKPASSPATPQAR